MNRVEAMQMLQDSFAKPSATPCTWREDRDAYIQEEQARLRASVIEPIEVQAAASGWAQQYAGQTGEVRKFFALAQSGEKWLLYEPSQHEFALAYGKSATAGQLSLLGFSSPDALAEWLG